jgi:nucleoside-diphosphate-sugar epimerase
MKIIITGAAGFVGSNLSKYLEDKGNVVGKLSLRKSDWILNKNADVIIHLAGKAHDTANTSADDEYFKVNRDLTIRLFEEFLNSEIRDFIYFSSVKATADTIEGILDENHPSDPKTPYGKSKLEAENYLLAQELPENKRLFIIRPCMIHGPGNKGNLNLLQSGGKRNSLAFSRF